MPAPSTAARKSLIWVAMDLQVTPVGWDPVPKAQSAHPWKIGGGRGGGSGHTREDVRIDVGDARGHGRFIRSRHVRIHTSSLSLVSYNHPTFPLFLLFLHGNNKAHTDPQACSYPLTTTFFTPCPLAHDQNELDCPDEISIPDKSEPAATQHYHSISLLLTPPNSPTQLNSPAHHSAPDTRPQQISRSKDR